VTLGRLANRAELYSVDAVTEVGRDEGRNEAIRRECPRQYSARCGGGRPSGAHEWHATRMDGDGGTVLSVIHTRPRAGEAIARLELAATCTNGDRAGRMPVGTRFTLDANAETCSAEMLHRPTPLVKPPAGGDAAGALCDDVGVPRLSLLGRDAADALRTRLHTLACPGWVTEAGLPAPGTADAHLAVEGLIGVVARASGDYRLSFEPGHYPGQAPWLFSAVVGEYLRRGTGTGTPPRVVADLTGTRRDAT
jgi:type VI protein secretion system component VasA